MRQWGLAAARLASAAWAGAATLFVATAIREVTYAGFDSSTKDALAALRFPPYYAFGFALTTIALVGGVMAAADRQSAHRGVRTAVMLLGLALVLMIVDYVAV